MCLYFYILCLRFCLFVFDILISHTHAGTHPPTHTDTQAHTHMYTTLEVAGASWCKTGGKSINRNLWLTHSNQPNWLRGEASRLKINFTIHTKTHKDKDKHAHKHTHKHTRTHKYTIKSCQCLMSLGYCRWSFLFRFGFHHWLTVKVWSQWFEVELPNVWCWRHSSEVPWRERLL